jgi:hypothetical protein
MNTSDHQEPLRAYTLDEARYYLTVTACASCGKGPWIIDATIGPDPAGKIAIVEARCKHCHAARKFEFICDSAVVAGDNDQINPTEHPSRIIDLGQWLSLFYLLVESAASDSVAPTTRRKGYQAALCLAEALKFYGDDELPPPPAFFSPATAQAFRDHPEKFARQKLRDILSRLPALPLMARRVSRDQLNGRRRWWRFWRRYTG